MSIKYKIASMTILVALIPMIVLTVLMLFFYNRAIMQRADNQINENIRIMSDRISSVLANGELCSNNLTIEFSGYYNDKSMKQVTRDNKGAYRFKDGNTLFGLCEKSLRRGRQDHNDGTGKKPHEP